MILVLVAIIVVAIINLTVLFSFPVSAKFTEIPEGMSASEFKAEVARANGALPLPFLSAITGSGTWRITNIACHKTFPYECYWGNFDPDTTSAGCYAGEVKSNCFISPDYATSNECDGKTPNDCCLYSVSKYGVTAINMQCYCTKQAVQCSGGADPGEKKCEGNNVYKCSNDGVWEFYESCSSNEKCQDGQCIISCISHYEKKCYNGDVYWYNSCGEREDLVESCDYKCENGRCTGDPCEGVTCEDKCDGNVRLYNGYCDPSTGECIYEETYCDYGCRGGKCIGNPCEGVTCEDYCSDSIYYYDGYCDPSTGECEYLEQDCAYGCEGDKCATDPCEGVTCEDYCSDDGKNTLYYDGKCIGGECKNYKEKEYAYECGYSPWYLKYWWIWLILGLIIIGTFILVLFIGGWWYFKRRK